MTTLLTTRAATGARDETGASAVEYGLIVSSIAALIAVAVFGFGGAVGDLFATSCGEVASAAKVSATC